MMAYQNKHHNECTASLYNNLVNSFTTLVKQVTGQKISCNIVVPEPVNKEIVDTPNVKDENSEISIVNDEVHPVTDSTDNEPYRTVIPIVINKADPVTDNADDLPNRTVPAVTPAVNTMSYQQCEPKKKWLHKRKKKNMTFSD
jgi:hypothetical protein